MTLNSWRGLFRANGGQSETMERKETMILNSERLRIKSVKEYIRQPYAWPGGYPKVLITADGGCLCSHCARKEFRLICEESFDNTNHGFRAAGVGVNWENTDLHCDHCGKQMECAYGESE
jgi:hypothetical protein